jgi:formylglycine-generating enzyme required for sulfatase activity
MNTMKNTSKNSALAACGLALLQSVAAQAADPVINNITTVPRLTITSDLATADTIQYSTDLSQTNWLALTNLMVDASPYWFVDATAPPSPQRFYRVVASPLPSGMGLIPAGSFTMGDALDGEADAMPTHTVTVSAFYMDKTLVTYALWKQIYQWATNHGYTFDNPGMGKADNHPVQTVDWYDAVKWCNARSEMEGVTPCYFTSAGQTNIYRTSDVNLANSFVNWSANGYRLPTEAEWEKAARGGAGGHRFPWTDTETVNTSRANYYADPTTYAYDISAASGNDPIFNNGVEPYTSPVGYFAPNGYGLYDMAGNVVQWCWDWRAPYTAATQTDPRGPASGSGNRIARGGTWCCGPDRSSQQCRVAFRDLGQPVSKGYGLGLRCVRSVEQ